MAEVILLVTFAGVGYAARHGRHIRMSAIYDHMPNKARKVLVTAVKRQNATVLVDGPVKPGDLVIVEGVQRLRPGRAVRFERATDPKPKPPAAAAAKD